MLAPWKKSYDKPRQHVKKQRHHFANKGHYSKRYDFSSSYAWMWELNHKEWWTVKNWCFWTVVLEKTLESSLDSKEIKPVNPKGNQPWLFIGRTDVEAAAPILWPPDANSWLTVKYPGAGKDRGQEERGKQRMICWMVSANQWTQVWANSRRLWRTGKPGVLQSMESQIVRHDRVTEQQQK